MLRHSALRSHKVQLWNQVHPVVKLHWWPGNRDQALKSCSLVACSKYLGDRYFTRADIHALSERMASRCALWDCSKGQECNQNHCWDCTTSVHQSVCTHPLLGLSNIHRPKCLYMPWDPCRKRKGWGDTHRVCTEWLVIAVLAPHLLETTYMLESVEG